MHEAVATFIAERVHDGWRPVDIMHELQRTAHHGAQLLAAHGQAEHAGVAAYGGPPVDSITGDNRFIPPDADAPSSQPEAPTLPVERAR